MLTNWLFEYLSIIQCVLGNLKFILSPSESRDLLEAALAVFPRFAANSHAPLGRGQIVQII